MNYAAIYRAHLAEVGETITVRRYTGTGTPRPKTDVEALARVTGYQAAELMGGLQEGDRRVILLACDVEALAPLTRDDRLVIRGKELAIQAIDDSTRRVGGELIAYEITARG